MRPISGRFCAAWINSRACCDKYSGALPERSCSIIVKPAPVPRPGIGGGPNAIAIAPGTSFAMAPLIAATTPLAWDAGVSRSPHGFSETKKNAVFDAVDPVSSENPVTVVKVSICGLAARIPSIFCATRSVRSSDDASGNCTFSRINPWSSSGTKPPGIRLASNTVNPTTMPIKIILRMDFRIRIETKPT